MRRNSAFDPIQTLLYNRFSNPAFDFRYDQAIFKGQAFVLLILRMRDIFERAIYRHGWDTRCRNWVPAQILRRLLKNLPSQNEPILFDVGCGRIGMAAFLNGAKVVGVDVEPPLEHVENFTFQRGTITDLQFPDKSFSVVSCIEVLEHLPLEARDRAIAELVRVASRAVLVACPHGENGPACDVEFQKALENRGRPIPEWLAEHQQEDGR